MPFEVVDTLHTIDRWDRVRVIQHLIDVVVATSFMQDDVTAQHVRNFGLDAPKAVGTARIQRRAYLDKVLDHSTPGLKRGCSYSVVVE